MTYDQIGDEIVDLRFNPSTLKRAQVDKWINLAEVQIWDTADWNFKRVPVTNITVTAGAATEPNDFGKAIALYDSGGTPLQYMDPDDFEQLWSVGTPPTSSYPMAYTVINRQILVGPSVSGTFKLAYRRRYSHLADGSSPTVGVMNSANDTPIWDSEFHYILVPTAMAIGMTLENDPTALPIFALKDQILRQMMNEHVGGVEKITRYWGEEVNWSGR